MEANSEAVRRIGPYLAGPSDARSEIISNRYRAYSRTAETGRNIVATGSCPYTGPIIARGIWS